MEPSDISNPSQRPPVSLGRRYLPWVMGFAPPVGSPHPRVAVVHGHRWTGPIEGAGDGRFSQVSGEPICMHAPLFDPGGTTSPCPNGRGRCCLPGTKHRRPHALSSFEAQSRSLHARCLRFTVGGRPLTVQDSLPARWLDVNGTGFSPVGFRTRISRGSQVPPFPTSQTYLAHLVQATRDTAKAEVCFHRALKIAKGQHAKSLELRTTISLAKLWQSQNKRQDAYDLLAPVYNWFTEGFDTADLKDAKVLLDELEG
jgi:hypothetical protein